MADDAEPGRARPEHSCAERILVTGAAGRIGSFLRERLVRSGRVLRLLDLAPLKARVGEESVVGSVTDMAVMERACRDVDAVIHLAASPEFGWDELVDVDVRGAYVVFEAARRQRVRRVVFASSNHVVGEYPRSEAPAGDCLAPMPDSYFGIAKATGEALGAFYHHRFGLEVVVVRILSCYETPTNLRMLSTWLSPNDAGRLFEASLAPPDVGYRVVWGVSDNTRGWFSLDAARALGYQPQDNAESYAAELVHRYGEPDLTEADHRRIGGQADYFDPPQSPARHSRVRALVRRVAGKLGNLK